MTKRKGRPRRSDVERDASGKISTALYRPSRAERKDAKAELERDIKSVVTWRRVKDLVHNAAIDPRMGSELGRMFVFGVISAEQFEAGTRFGDALADYDRIYLPQRRTAQAQDLNKVNGVSLHQRDETKERATAKSVMSRIDRCLGALGCEVKSASGDALNPARSWPPVARITTELCRGEAIRPVDVINAVFGLTLLVDSFGLKDSPIQRARRKKADVSKKGNLISDTEKTGSE